MTRHRLARRRSRAVVAPSRPSAAHRRRDEKTTANVAVSGSISIIGEPDRPRAEAFEAVLDGLQPSTRTSRSSTPRRAEPPTILSTAVQGGNPPDIARYPAAGAAARLRQPGALKPITFVKRAWRRRTTPPAGSSSAPSRASSTPSTSRARTSPPSGINVRLQERRSQGPRRRGRSSWAWPRPCGHRAAGLLDRRRRRVDAHGPLREHLHPHGRVGEVRPAHDPQDQVDGPSVKDGAQDDGAGARRPEQHRRRDVRERLQTDFLTSVEQAFRPSAEGGDGDRGRLRARESSRRSGKP